MFPVTFYLIIFIVTYRMQNQFLRLYLARQIYKEMVIFNLGFRNVVIGFINEVATLTWFSYNKMYMGSNLPGQLKVINHELGK